MRTKQTRELEAQEQSWIYLLHAQNPPAARDAAAAIVSRGDGGGAPLLPGFDTVSGGVQDRNSVNTMPLAGAAHMQRSYNQHSDVGSHYAAVAAAAAAAANSTSFEQNAYAASTTSFDDSRLFNVNGPYARGPEFILRQPVMPPTAASSKSETKPWTSASLPAMPYASSASASSGQFPFVSVGSKRPYEEKPQQSAKSLLVDLLPKSKRDAQLKQEAPMISTQEDEIDQEDQEYAASAGGSSGKRNCFPKKCDFPMCKNSSRSRGFCYSHGGGRRCRIDGCSNGAVSRDLCKRHGGGRRCRINGCKSSSESGGLCYSHGGGRRCSLSWCSARAKKGGFCAVHLVDDKADRPAASSSSSTMVVKQSNAVETLLSLAMDKKAAAVEAPRQVSSNAHALASILN